VPADGTKKITKLVPPGGFVVEDSNTHPYYIENPAQLIIGNADTRDINFRRPQLNSYAGAVMTIKRHDNNPNALFSGRNTIDDNADVDGRTTLYFYGTSDSATIVGNTDEWKILNEQRESVPQPGAIVHVNSNTTIEIPMQIVLVTTGASNTHITMPDWRTGAGKQFIIKKIDAGVGVVHIEGQDTSIFRSSPSAVSIDPLQLNSQYDAVTLRRYAPHWIVVDE
jgi:hypothetical protein